MYECQKRLESMERHLSKAQELAKAGAEPAIHGFKNTITACRVELEKLQAKGHEFLGRVSHVPAQWDTYRSK
jgi:hypothetical protein